MESDLYYIRFRAKEHGPFTAEELKERARRGQFGRHYAVSTDNVNWKRASEFPELFPTQPPRKPSAATAVPSDSRGDILLSEDFTGRNGAPPALPSAADGWYYTQAGRRIGPVGFSNLQFLVGTGQVAPDDLVWTEGMPNWSQVKEVPGLTSMDASAPRIPVSDSPVPGRRGLELSGSSLGCGLLVACVAGAIILAIVLSAVFNSY